MNVYLTYDRYERDEWYSVYHVEKNLQRAYKHFKEVDLPSFICYGPDDCHSFQLQKIVMTSKQYKHLCYLIENEGNQDCDTSDELKDLLIRIYDEDEEFEIETICATDGCSDVWDVVRYYCNENNINCEDDDEYQKAQELLFNNDDLFEKYLKEYIDIYY